MALANVAVHLAQRGRRVLVVDFDLEAPGLDTFPSLRPEEPVRGLVDYVVDYLETDHAPDIRGFVGKSPAFENMVVMPSGAMEKGYAASFGQIDWGALYDQRDGYLLFENLKAQWLDAFAPDYVLVDSRTGFTDTGGICTRQLPDAVTVLFFPNEQNLRGLAKVVTDIRSEAETPRQKSIELHFVMSNVPDLDDEDDILTEMKERFQRELAFDEEPLVVHRYDSLSLLNQSVFALDRPRSRLAREYRRVADRTVRNNLADPDGALQFIRERRQRLDRFRYVPSESSADLGEAIKQIEGLHSKDGEVLFRLGQLARRGELTNAEALLGKALEAGYLDPEVYLERARARSAVGDEAGASQDALSVLKFDDLPSHVVLQTVRFLSNEDTVGVENSAAINSLAADDQIDVAENLERVTAQKASDAILRRLVEDEELTSTTRTRASSQLSLNFIASGRFNAAIELLERDGRGIDQMGTQDAFNYAMAVWGDSGKITKAYFERVLEEHAFHPRDFENANYRQCLAVASWGAGHPQAARDHLEQARKEAETERTIFSCWRYREVRRDEFLEDTDEILALIGGDKSRVPRFLVRANDPSPMESQHDQSAPGCRSAEK